MDRSKITLIRPLIYAPEKNIKAFVKRNNILFTIINSAILYVYNNKLNQKVNTLSHLPLIFHNLYDKYSSDTYQE